MVWSTAVEDAIMPLDISSPANAINNQSAFKLVDVCLDNKLHISRKSLLRFAEVWKIDYSKTAKIWLVKF